jgi:hypothetical protein
MVAEGLMRLRYSASRAILVSEPLSSKIADLGANLLRPGAESVKRRCCSPG